MTFKKATVAAKPTLFGTGTVDQVLPGKMSAKGVYVVQNFKLEGIGASTSAYTNLLYRIQWLDPKFNPLSFDVPKTSPDFKAQNSQKFVYGKSLVSSRNGQVATLQGLCVDEETYNGICDKLMAIPQPTTEAETEDFILRVTEVLQSLKGMEVGYVLRQASAVELDSEGEQVIDSDGKVVRTLSDQYEVEEYFAPTKDNLKRYRVRASKGNAKNPGSIVVSFDGE